MLPPSAPTKVVIPDLVSHCEFTPRLNRACLYAAPASENWLAEGGKLSEKKKSDFRGLRAGLLTSMCYPDASLPELQVCCDFMNCAYSLRARPNSMLTFGTDAADLFHLCAQSGHVPDAGMLTSSGRDELTDDMDNRSETAAANLVMDALYHPSKFENKATIATMTRRFVRRDVARFLRQLTSCRSYFQRFLTTASSGAAQRFIETMEFFFQAVHQQALDRRSGEIPDLESYIALRRDTSGCKPCWALIEYANGLYIPDDVMEHPSLVALGEAANDLVTWSNVSEFLSPPRASPLIYAPQDIFSYNVEQSRGDTHNMICVVMDEQGLDLQAAVDFVG
jgi:hypothetical protein